VQGNTETVDGFKPDWQTLRAEGDNDYGVPIGSTIRDDQTERGDMYLWIDHNLTCCRHYATRLTGEEPHTTIDQMSDLPETLREEIAEPGGV
jgi:hypothetical protein